MARSIVLKTAVPGPRSAALSGAGRRPSPAGISHATPIFAERAAGALLTDVDGNVLHRLRRRDRDPERRPRQSRRSSRPPGSSSDA